MFNARKKLILSLVLTSLSLTALNAHARLVDRCQFLPGTWTGKLTMIPANVDSDYTGTVTSEAELRIGLTPFRDQFSGILEFFNYTCHGDVSCADLYTTREKVTVNCDDSSIQLRDDEGNDVTAQLFAQHQLNFSLTNKEGKFDIQLHR